MNVEVEEARDIWLVSHDYWISAKRLSDRLELDIGHSMVLRAAWSVDRAVRMERDERYWEALAAYLEFVFALDESIALGRKFKALRDAAVSYE